MSVRVMADVWDLDLPRDEKIVLLALADHADDDGVCWPSIDRIAWKCGYSRSSVKRKLKSLAARKVLFGEMKFIGGRGNTPRYMVVAANGSKLAPFKKRGPTEAERGPPETVKGSIATAPESSVEPPENHQQALFGDSTPTTDGNGVPKVDLFPEFWGLAVRKKGKLAAERAFKRAIVRPDAGELMVRWAEYNAGIEITMEGLQFEPHPSTWLNEGRWMDQDIEPPDGVSAAGGTVSPDSTATYYR